MNVLDLKVFHCMNSLKINDWRTSLHIFILLFLVDIAYVNITYNNKIDKTQYHQGIIRRNTIRIVIIWKHQIHYSISCGSAKDCIDKFIHLEKHATLEIVQTISCSVVKRHDKVYIKNSFRFCFTSL